MFPLPLLRIFHEISGNKIFFFKRWNQTINKIQIKSFISADYRQGGEASETRPSAEDNEDIQASETFRRPPVPHLHIAPGTGRAQVAIYFVLSFISGAPAPARAPALLSNDAMEPNSEENFFIENWVLLNNMGCIQKINNIFLKSTKNLRKINL